MVNLGEWAAGEPRGSLPYRFCDDGLPPTVIVFMHGCCGGNKTSWESDRISTPWEKWHQSNAWFAARGYVVVNYTARGFVTANDEGSTCSGTGGASGPATGSFWS